MSSYEEQEAPVLGCVVWIISVIVLWFAIISLALVISSWLE